ESVPPGFIGNAVTGTCFYTGSSYPPEFQGRLFVQDYGGNWIRTFTLDSGYAIAQMDSFASAADAPVDLIASPFDGDLYYVSIATSRILRIRYVGDALNGAPVARASATPPAGVQPLAVAFTGAASQDPDLDPLTYIWQFGDGATDGGRDVQHVYASS